MNTKEQAVHQLQDTPINRAFLFLYKGAVSGSVKIPPITDMSDEKAEIWPTISGVAYMENAMNAQIQRESEKDARAQCIEAALRQYMEDDCDPNKQIRVVWRMASEALAK